MSSNNVHKKKTNGNEGFFVVFFFFFLGERGLLLQVDVAFIFSKSFTIMDSQKGANICICRKLKYYPQVRHHTHDTV